MACGPRTMMMELEVALKDTYWAPAASSRTSSSMAVTGEPGGFMHRLVSGPSCDRSWVGGRGLSDGDQSKWDQSRR